MAPYCTTFENSLRGIIFSHSLTRVQFYHLAIDLDPFLTHPGSSCRACKSHARYDAWLLSLQPFSHSTSCESVMPQCSRQTRPYVPHVRLLLPICFQSIFPCLFSISAFHTRFSKRKGHLLTCSTPPPLTPLFLSQVHAVLKRLHCSRSRFLSFSFLHHARHARIFHTVRHPALLQRAGLGL